MHEQDLLPATAKEILRSNNASARLTAHHQLVYKVAKELVQSIQTIVPEIVMDIDQILMGVALHDIGKTIVLNEITQPGHLHEELGEKLLLQQGIEPRVARFARTHGMKGDQLELDDLLVILADKVWKGKREQWLEDALLLKLLEHSKQDRWELFIAIDSLIESIALGADRRLAWYAQHPV